MKLQKRHVGQRIRTPTQSVVEGGRTEEDSPPPKLHLERNGPTALREQLRESRPHYRDGFAVKSLSQSGHDPGGGQEGDQSVQTDVPAQVQGRADRHGHVQERALPRLFGDSVQEERKVHLMSWWAFSHSLYNRFCDRMEWKKEGNRKRTTSGTRPLSSIGDGLDAFDSLGIERGPDGQVKNHRLAPSSAPSHDSIVFQEVSYAYLLIPSKNPKDFRERRINTIDDPTEPAPTSARPHHVIARYNQSFWHCPCDPSFSSRCWFISSYTTCLSLKCFLTVQHCSTLLNPCHNYLSTAFFAFCRTKVITWQPKYKW